MKMQCKDCKTIYEFFKGEVAGCPFCNNNFGLMLCHYRNKKGLYPKDLAIKSMLTTSAINQFENGLRLPSEDAILRLSNALDIDKSLLLNQKEIALKRFNQTKTIQVFECKKAVNNAK